MCKNQDVLNLAKLQAKYRHLMKQTTVSKSELKDVELELLQYNMPPTHKNDEELESLTIKILSDLENLSIPTLDIVDK